MVHTFILTVNLLRRWNKLVQILNIAKNNVYRDSFCRHWQQVWLFCTFFCNSIFWEISITTGNYYRKLVLFQYSLVRICLQQIKKIIENESLHSVLKVKTIIKFSLHLSSFKLNLSKIHENYKYVTFFEIFLYANIVSLIEVAYFHLISPWNLPFQFCVCLYRVSH